MQEGLRYDSVLWEMLALAYFEAWHTDPSVPAEYAAKAADCFSRVIELGVTKEYLYSNLYTIYYELKDYDRAEQALAAYEAKFPEDYMPHALRGMLLVTVENEKPQAGRDCSAGFRSIHLHTKGTDKTPGCNRSASGRFERVGSGQNFRFFTDDFVRPSHTSDPEWESKICRAP